MERNLKSIYLRWLAAIALVWAAFRIAQHLIPEFSMPPQTVVCGGPVVFILTTACALAGPILYRTLFAHSKRACAHISTAAFVRFERYLILIGMAALGFAMAADMLGVPSFYRSGALLTAFYAAYCVFPSHKRLMLDRRLYRVATEHRGPRATAVYPKPVTRQTRPPGEKRR